MKNYKMKQLLLFIVFSIFSLQPIWAQLYEEVTYLSKDSLEITADFYIHNKNAPIILMFHQSVSSRGEYRDIAPKLLSNGFNCIAVDLRWGKRDFWNKVYNKTAQKNGTYSIVDNYEDTEEYQLKYVWSEIFNSYFDMEATLKYLNDEGYIGEKIVMGSSFSAMLAFKLANEHFDEIGGVLAFSPGEYHPTQDSLLYSWSRNIKVPVYISSGKGTDEYNMTQSIYLDLPQVKIKKLYQSEGRHGSSVLISQEKDWVPLFEFLSLYNSKGNSIGFRTIDYNREGKTIPVNLWYPIRVDTLSNFTKMLFSDYVSKIRKDQSFTANKALFARMLDSYGTIDSVRKHILVNEFLNAEIPVFNASEFPTGRYPLVIICGANPIYHIELAEKIAKNGFVVASIPRLGITQGERLPFNQQGSAEYKSDLEFVISSLSEYEFVDEHQISFISWSFEGVPSLETALSNPSTNLFFSLDSSIGYEYGNSILSDSAAIHRLRIEFPLLHFTNSSIDFGKDLSILKELQLNNTNVEIDESIELSHLEFTSIGSITVNKINKNKVNSTYNLLLMYILDRLRKTTANN